MATVSQAAVETGKSRDDATGLKEPLSGAVPDDDEIHPTDIVFDCPHCGHSLCIDYRGAGLLANCTECSKEVQVPIPEGMNLGDLDLTAEQTLGHLFYTRRALTNAEERIAELEEVVNSLKDRRSAMEKARMTTLHRCAELSGLCQSIQHSQNEITGALSRILEIIAAEQQH